MKSRLEFGYFGVARGRHATQRIWSRSCPSAGWRTLKETPVVLWLLLASSVKTLAAERPLALYGAFLAFFAPRCASELVRIAPRPSPLQFLQETPHLTLQ